MSYAAGRLDAPLCLNCLAQELARPAPQVRDELAGFILRKECLAMAWRAETEREGFVTSAPPRCLWRDATTAAAAASPSASVADVRGAADARWDAGELGCGDLVLELRMRLRELAAGDVLHLTARDPGAPEDLPAWCRLTGNELVAARHPDYWIRRRN
jgi:tRNA 2-thiouridine synthesizing protein A